MKTLRPQLSRFQSRVACLLISLALYLFPLPGVAASSLECEMPCCKHGVKHHADHKSAHSKPMVPDRCSNAPCALEAAVTFGRLECLVSPIRSDVSRDSAGPIISAVSTLSYPADRQPETSDGRIKHRKSPPLYLQQRTFLI